MLIHYDVEDWYSEENEVVDCDEDEGEENDELFYDDDLDDDEDIYGKDDME